MKVYFAIMLALLLATAYGIKSKQATTGTTAVVDTTTMNTSNDTCDSSSSEYDNGSGMCTWANNWCEDGLGSSTSDYNDSCEDGSYYNSHCENSYDTLANQWSQGMCTSSGCYSDQCYDCANEYYSDWSSEKGSSYSNNSCTNSDGSSDCKLTYFIILLASSCIFYSFLLYSKLQFMQ
jgi:hypothetical protein